MKKIMSGQLPPSHIRGYGFGARFLFGSTVHTTETALWEDKKEYPKLVVEISSKSHPFYTGEERTLDKAGRVEKFKQRAAAKK